MQYKVLSNIWDSIQNAEEWHFCDAVYEDCRFYYYEINKEGICTASFIGMSIEQ